MKYPLYIMIEMRLLLEADAAIPRRRLRAVNASIRFPPRRCHASPPAVPLLRLFTINGFSPTVIRRRRHLHSGGRIFPGRRAKVQNLLSRRGGVITVLLLGVPAATLGAAHFSPDLLEQILILVCGGVMAAMAGGAASDEMLAQLIDAASLGRLYHVALQAVHVGHVS